MSHVFDTPVPSEVELKFPTTLVGPSGLSLDDVSTSVVSSYESPRCPRPGGGSGVSTVVPRGRTLTTVVYSRVVGYSCVCIPSPTDTVTPRLGVETT